MGSLLEQASPNLDRKHRPILAAMKSSEGYRFSALYSLSDPCDRRRVQPGIEVARMHADHLLPAVAQALASLPIDVENGLVLVEQEESIRRVIDQAAKALLARAQLILRALALRDVARQRQAVPMCSLLEEASRISTGNTVPSLRR